ncbi:alpha/beta fold hydrolase [Devosia nitrariae]|uniref:Oxidoreductase n=1 Tax=Devosia nitrariae TaxID=2071872 RepID=A0ABQ5W1U7_9HYPH|nr:alpha/beta hydrolase [Devosia nitrariae]GLQ53857.1 oxidoreductase [Devosia nitrariae]
MTTILRTTLTAAALVAAGAALAQETPEGNRVEINGMQMYYEVSGTGDPMIVLHGGFMNIPMMGDIVGQLAQTHQVYALEAQGHGRTTDIDRPITYPNLAGDVAAFMEVVGIEKADVFGYSMGAMTGLRLAIDFPEKVDQLVFTSGAYDYEGWQPAFQEAIPQWNLEMFTSSPFAEDYKVLAADPEGFPAMAEKVIELEKLKFAWGEEVAALETPVLIIAGDSDGMTLEHSVDMFRLLGGGVMGDTGEPLPASRLAILPASSHTAVINQPDLLMEFIGPFLAGETPKTGF